MVPPAAVPIRRLPTLALPDVLNVPTTFMPVPVTTTTFALPATLVDTLLFAATTTLLFPLRIVLPPAIDRLESK